jgi:hypothetical protein
MSENIENLVLEHLRHMRAAVDRIERRLHDLTIGVRLETSFAHMQTPPCSCPGPAWEKSDCFDRVEARLARIEKRLELADA